MKRLRVVGGQRDGEMIEISDSMAAQPVFRLPRLNHVQFKPLPRPDEPINLKPWSIDDYRIERLHISSRHDEESVLELAAHMKLSPVQVWRLLLANYNPKTTRSAEICMDEAIEVIDWLGNLLADLHEKVPGVSERFSVGELLQQTLRVMSIRGKLEEAKRL